MSYDIKHINCNAKLEYNVLFYDFNDEKIISKNIFYKGALADIIEYIKREIELPTGLSYEITYNIIKKCIIQWAKYNYWSKREYEIGVGDFGKDGVEKYKKIDIYYQIMLNVDLITKYFCNEIFIKVETDKMSVDKNDKDKNIKELSEEIENLNNQINKLKFQDIPYLKGYIEGMKEFQRLK